MACGRCGKRDCGCIEFARPGSKDDWLGCVVIPLALITLGVVLTFVGALMPVFA